MRTTFPLDPPLKGSCSWDALSDSLVEGLYTHSAQRIAIVWQGTFTMASAASDDFQTAVDVLSEVAGLLADRNATRGATKEVAILVE